MKDPVIKKTKYSVILYDPDVAGKIIPEWFDPVYWQDSAKVSQTEEGRGGSYFIQSHGQDWVLRHYHRGGLMAHLSSDCYLWPGWKRTRPWREFKLLSELISLELPVARPIAARVERHGMVYRGDILVERIKDTVPLSRLILNKGLGEGHWHNIGKCIARFHHASVYHADLNAHNILLRGGEVYLIDFDKGELRSAGNWRQDNLNRLNRSLSKLAAQNNKFQFTSIEWQHLLGGYHESPKYC